MPVETIFLVPFAWIFPFAWALVLALKAVHGEAAKLGKQRGRRL